MTLNWWTLALQSANFLVLVWLLYRLLYRPVRDVIEKRKALVAGAMDEANRARDDAAAARAHYEQECAKLAAQNDAARRDLHREAEAERDRMLADARREAERLAAAARTRLTEERDDALAALRGDAASLAADLAAGILAKSAPEHANDAMLETLARRLAGAAPDERNRLAADLARGSARLEVAVAAPLPPEGQQRWRARLTQALGTAADIAFTVDPALLGGAELRFPHAVLGFTWRDQLDRAKQALSHDARPA